ncbi:hypothetical protein OKW40_006356 [Paraburkholderia sp. RAU6.4a]
MTMALRSGANHIRTTWLHDMSGDKRGQIRAKNDRYEWRAWARPGSSDARMVRSSRRWRYGEGLRERWAGCATAHAVCVGTAMGMRCIEVRSACFAGFSVAVRSGMRLVIG